MADSTQQEPCPTSFTLDVISGKWKTLILYYLFEHKILRFNQFGRHIPDITRHTLTKQLRQLEEDGIIARKVYAEVPPRVEYSLTDYGLTLQPILDVMHQWGMKHHTNGNQDDPAET